MHYGKECITLARVPWEVVYTERAFDPNRRAVILLGGDKRGDWTGWYERNIPIADDLYDVYLREET